MKKVLKVKPFTLHNEIANEFKELFDIETIYHYTTSAVIQQYLDPAKAMLYCTWAKALNDDQEYKAGIEFAVGHIAETMHLSAEVFSMVKQILQKMEEEKIRELVPWVMSFSHAQDRLSQWIAYTDRAKGGFALGFSFKLMEKFVKKIVTEKRRKYKGKSIPYSLNLLPCFYLDYEDEKQIDLLLRFFRFLFVKYFNGQVKPLINTKNSQQYAFAIVRFIWLFASVVKHAAFKDEKEYRLVVQLTDSSYEKHVEIVGDKPRIRIAPDVNSSDIVKLITEVWTSPHGDKEMLDAVPYYLIKRHGLNIEQHFSDLPFNGR